mgnify:CR=1 FL=1
MGIGAEVFSLETLKEAWAVNKDPVLREHIALNLQMMVLFGIIVN